MFLQSSNMLLIVTQPDGGEVLATAEEAGKEIVVFFSGGFAEVDADEDTCFDNATCIIARLE